MPFSSPARYTGPRPGFPELQQQSPNSNRQLPLLRRNLLPPGVPAPPPHLGPSPGRLHQHQAPSPAPDRANPAPRASVYTVRQGPTRSPCSDDEDHSSTQLIMLLIMSVLLLTLPWVVDHPVTLLVPVVLLVLPFTSGVLRSVVSEGFSMMANGFRWFWQNRTPTTQASQAPQQQHHHSAVPGQQQAAHNVAPGVWQQQPHGTAVPPEGWHAAAAPPHHHAHPQHLHHQPHPHNHYGGMHAPAAAAMQAAAQRPQPHPREWQLQQQQQLYPQHPQPLLHPQQHAHAMYARTPAIQPIPTAQGPACPLPAPPAHLQELVTPDLDFDSESDWEDRHPASRGAAPVSQPHMHAHPGQPYPAAYMPLGHQPMPGGQAVGFYVAGVGQQQQQQAFGSPVQQQQHEHELEQQAECTVRNWESPDCSSRRGHKPLAELLSNGQ